MRLSATKRDNSKRQSESLKRWENNRNEAFSKAEEIRKLFEDGNSFFKITKLTGVSKHYIKQILCHTFQ